MKCPLCTHTVAEPLELLFHALKKHQSMMSTIMSEMTETKVVEEVDDGEGPDWQAV